MGAAAGGDALEPDGVGRDGTDRATDNKDQSTAGVHANYPVSWMHSEKLVRPPAQGLGLRPEGVEEAPGVRQHCGPFVGAVIATGDNPGGKLTEPGDPLAQQGAGRSGADRVGPPARYGVLLRSRQGLGIRPAVAAVMLDDSRSLLPIGPFAD
ncbi:hypothetical protein QR78_05660 [Methylobacterium indicum]|uniref:Uncharacterized protein n=1 Tax=Methylobacterium indicum TaxID=1775910 RepID=A0ABR5HGL1_9HYPH|nr:hypothetical protein QR78_05660 [Methylobacterium indicum]KMO25671.1 hypothetical protein QR79_06430 [Methylobacterium indicum]